MVGLPVFCACLPWTATKAKPHENTAHRRKENNALAWKNAAHWGWKCPHQTSKHLSSNFETCRQTMNIGSGEILRGYVIRRFPLGFGVRIP